MDNFWDTTLEQLTQLLNPQGFNEYWQANGLDDDEDPTNVAFNFVTPGLLTIAVAMFTGFFEASDPQSALSDAEFNLKYLWKLLINKRDTSGLSDLELARDAVLVEQLELMKAASEGLLAVFESYALQEIEQSSDINLSFKQVVERAESNREEAQALFARAGAAALQGAAFWPLWRLEATGPAKGWFMGLNLICNFLQSAGLYPLEPFAQQRRKLNEDEVVTPLPFESESVESNSDAGNLASPQDFLAEKLTPNQERLMAVLLCGKERLSPKQLKSLPPFTPDVINQLIYVLNTDEYIDDWSPGKGWAPIHAARLLGQSGSERAIVPLIEVFHHNDSFTIIHDEAILALAQLGSVALPALLQTLQYSHNPEIKVPISDALSRIGHGNDHVYNALETFYKETTWSNDRMFATIALAEQGDPRAVPIFYEALHNDEDLHPQGIREIVAALKELDPHANSAELSRLSDEAQKRYDSHYVHFDSQGQAICRDCGKPMQRNLLGEWDHVSESLKPQRSSPLVVPQSLLPPIDPRFAKVGRNDPCPCGSGKKFKYCHGSTKPTIN